MANYNNNDINMCNALKVKSQLEAPIKIIQNKFKDQIFFDEWSMIVATYLSCPTRNKVERFTVN